MWRSTRSAEILTILLRSVLLVMMVILYLTIPAALLRSTQDALRPTKLAVNHVLTGISSTLTSPAVWSTRSARPGLVTGSVCPATLDMRLRTIVA